MTTEQLRELFLQMTPEEKLGQMTQITAEHFVDGMDEDMVETGPDYDLPASCREGLYGVGSVLGVSGARAVNLVQKNFLQKNRLQIPLLFMHDAIHGYRTIFPIPLALSCSFDQELLRKVGRCTAKELRATGILVDFSPMTDLVRDARWGRVMESFGEDHLLSGNLGRAMIEGYQNSSDGSLGEDGVAACVKHFAAYGAACGGRDYGPVDMSWREFFGYYAMPYEIALKANPRFVMSSFNSLNGEPATASRYLLEEVLRERFGFEGIVISDWSAVAELLNHGIAADGREAAKAALTAGVEIEMTSALYLSFGRELMEQDEALARRVDEAVWKILCLKNELGLFENPYVDEEEEEKILLGDKMLAAAEEAALESCVLLKNEGLLPIKKEHKNILITGPFAATGELLGNWACKGRFQETISLAAGMREVFSASSIEICEDWERCPQEAFREADFIAAALGEPWELSGEGHSSAGLELPKEQRELIRRLKDSGREFAVLIFSGRPLALENVIEDIPALLWCWYPGTCGGRAAARILAGECSPSGKLTMSFPRVTGQTPVYYNECRCGRPAGESAYSNRYQDCEAGPLFPFGYGLSYGQIRYGDFVLSSTTFQQGETVTASVDLWNDGEYLLKETVLLFMEDPVSGLVRPERELLKYRKVTLGPGEQVRVAFEITPEDLKYLDHHLNRVLEPGIINLYLNDAKTPAGSLTYI